MGNKRSDKVRRRESRKQRRELKKRRREEQPGGRPLVGFRNPLFDLTPEDAESVVRHHHAKAAEARPRLLELLTVGDWRVMLSQISAYRLTLAVNEGVPVELDDEPVQPAVEYLQALALSLPSTTGRVQPTPYAIAAEALDHAQAVLFAETLPKKAPEPEEDWTRTAALASIRAHAIMVRGPGYPHQIERITHRISQRTGGASSFGASLVLRLMEACEARIFSALKQWGHLAGPAGAATSWKKAGIMLMDLLGVEEQEASGFLDRVRDALPDTDPRVVMATMLEAELPNVFTLDPAELAAEVEVAEETVQALLHQLSITPGELANYDLDWIPAANPCWRRPFIRMDAGYFLPIPGLLNAFKYDIMEQAFSVDNSLLKSYQRARSSVLELETAEHLSRVFGSDHVHTGLKWADPAEPGKAYETDVVVTFDNYLVVAECKSHAAREAARRGAPKATATLGKTVYLSAAEQSARLVRLLSESDQPITFETARGEEITIAPDPTRSAIRLTVTLDFIGGSASRASEQAAVTGRVADYAVSMPVTDLEIVCDALDRPEQLLHYLHSRTRLERRVTYFGDETDLLGFYLKTRFAGEHHGERNSLLLSPLGRQFDSWYLPDPATAAGPRGRIRNTPLWQSFIDRLKSSRGLGWARGAAILSGIPIEDQKRAEEGIESLRKRVRAVDAFLTTDHIMVMDATRQREEVIAIWVHPGDADRSEVRKRTMDAAQNIANQDNAEWLVVMAVSVEPTDGWPYTNCYVARRRSDP